MTELVTSFWFDAGMKSFVALCEYSVSPRSGSTTRIPQFALRKSRAPIIESIDRANTACARPGPDVVDGRNAAHPATDAESRTRRRIGLMKSRELIVHQTTRGTFRRPLKLLSALARRKPRVLRPNAGSGYSR